MQLPALNLGLMRGRLVYLRTRRHPVVPYLEREGIRLHSLDDFYERHASFDEVYREMAGFLLDAAAGNPEPVVFAVPGHPLVGETVVGILMSGAAGRGVRMRLWPAPSFLDAVLERLALDPAQGLVVTESFQMLRQARQSTHSPLHQELKPDGVPDGTSSYAPLSAGRAAAFSFLPSAALPFSVPPGAGVLVAQVYSRPLASEVKLTLMEQFPDDHPVTVVQAAGIPGRERLRRIPLYELDRLEDLDHLTSVYIPPVIPDVGRQTPEIGKRQFPAPDVRPPASGPWPPAPGSQHPATDIRPPAPGSQHPATDIRPPAPDSSIPAPDVRPPVPDSSIPAPDVRPPAPDSCRYPLDPLMEVMQKLLAPGGCPWDREQTHQSLRRYLIEEAYEVIDAIDEGNMHKLCEELGDLLLQVVFHAAIANSRGDFDMNRVVAGITAKLKRRHPHVFGDVNVNSAAEVVQNWEAIKQSERAEGALERAESATECMDGAAGAESATECMDGAAAGADGAPGGRPTRRQSLLAGVPRYLPALQRAQKVQGKAALVGFDWPDARSAAAKLAEEWQELQEAWADGDEDAIRREAGDLLFAGVNVARLLGVDAEEALRAAVDKFIRRFQSLEALAAGRGWNLRDLSLEELDAIWDEVKASERG
jgi:tetrapyrrole methylase family protein/MazG family protein